MLASIRRPETPTFLKRNGASTPPPPSPPASPPSPTRLSRVTAIVSPKKTRPTSDVDSHSRTSSRSRSPARTSTRAVTLTFAHIADLFIKLRRLEKRAKGIRITSISGDEPLTHPELDHPDGTGRRRAKIEIEIVFICKDAVDVTRLLRVTRSVLLDEATRKLNANALIDELWQGTINPSKQGGDDEFKVAIRYSATAVRSQHKDPQRPVALNKPAGVPGLMTVLSRETVSLKAELIQVDYPTTNSLRI